MSMDDELAAVPTLSDWCRYCLAPGINMLEIEGGDYFGPICDECLYRITRPVPDLNTVLRRP